MDPDSSEWKYLNNEKDILKKTICKAFPNLAAGAVKNKVNEYWQRICINPEQHKKKKISISIYNNIINDLNSKIMTNKASLMSMWGTIKKVPQNTNNQNNNVRKNKRSRSAADDDDDEDDEKIPNSKKRKISQRSWAQDRLQKEIDSMNSEIEQHQKDKQSPFVDISKINAAIKSKRDDRDKLQKKKNRLESNRKSQSKKRAKDKEIKQKYATEHPEDKTVIIKDGPGRPNVEMYYPHFSAVLIDIVNEYCSADPKRASKMLTYCDTLPRFIELVREIGYDISQQTLYLRLIPRRSNSIHGRLHVPTRTIPVKLAKPQEDDHGNHPSKRFCLAECRQNKQFAAMLGPSQCVYLGIDDKCKVPLGIAAANKQQSILMRVEYKLRLSDHSFAAADGHKLCPSVYGICDIKSNDFGNSKAVTYKGHTFIRIRSCKHDSSTTWDHGIDILSMYNTPSFKKSLWGPTGPKPVLIIRTDGGCDQNVRHQSNVTMYYNIFKKLKLDLLLISMSAPGASAFNSIERRMAPLSKKLVGVVLDHQKLGKHLDNNGKTIDDELEKQNFGSAAGILGDIWSESKCDGYTVDAKYVEPVDIDDKIAQFDEYDEEWADKHVKHGYFHLSIMKCDDPTCCGELRSNVKDILPNKYYPAPRWFTHNKGVLELGAKYTDPGKNHHYAHFNTICCLERSYSHGTNGDCHDDWNPMHTKESLLETHCRVCLKWFPSKTMMLKHRRKLHFRSRDNNLDDINNNDESDYDALLLEAEKEFYANINRICDDRNGQYLAEMNDGSKMWVVLDDDNEKVSSYLEGKDNLDDSIYNMPKIDNLKEWNLCPWVPDGDYFKTNEEDNV